MIKIGVDGIRASAQCAGSFGSDRRRGYKVARRTGVKSVQFPPRFFEACHATCQTHHNRSSRRTHVEHSFLGHYLCSNVPASSRLSILPSRRKPDYMDHSHMNHAGMDHGHMGHGGMDMGGDQCSMNVMKLLRNNAKT